MKWQVSESSEPVKILKMRSEDELRDYITDRKMSVVWSTIYQRQLIDRIRFPEGYNFEDVVFMAEALGKTDSLCYVNGAYCAYRLSEDSICRRSLTRKNMDIAYTLGERVMLVRRYFPKLAPLAEHSLWSHVSILYYDYLRCRKKEEARALMEIVSGRDFRSKLSWKSVFGRSLPLQSRVTMAMCKLCPHLALRFKSRLLITNESRIAAERKRGLV